MLRRLLSRVDWTRCARAFLALAFGYGTLGAILAVYAADVNGRPSLLRVGGALVLLAGVAAAGLHATRRGSVKA